MGIVKHWVLVAAPGAMALSAQTPDNSQSGSVSSSASDSCIPASTNVIAAQYPRVFADRRVMLRIKAPDAQRVQALIGGGRAQTPLMDIVKQSDGYWTLTTPPIVEGFHYYSFFVDGVETDAPGSRTFFGEMREISGNEIPSPSRDDSFYQIHDVQHGEVRSVLCKEERWRAQ
jgi:enterochelin esterase family protein